MKYIITILLLIPLTSFGMTALEYSNLKTNILTKAENKTLKLSEFKDFKFVLEQEKSKIVKKQHNLKGENIIKFLLKLLK